MKKFYLYLASLFLSYFIFLPAYAQISNGSFEQWNGNTPVGWSTIDTGITLNKETVKSKEGSGAASITVNTTSQSNTDLLQTIQVVPGQTYNFSVWIYQTNGNVRARFYVDGYRNYSDPTIRNQWQQISFAYTPSSASIVVGLRFYDLSGFSGSELVFVDDFDPSDSSGDGEDEDEDCTGLTLSLTTDNYGSETSWELHDDSGSTIHSGGNYGSNTSYQETFCLNPGDYNFIIFDAYGDGICCSYGNGAFSLTSDGETIASGGSFGSSASTSFSIGSEGPGNGDEYYSSTDGLSGFALKTELYQIIKDHTVKGYSALWTFYATHERDIYYENDGTILDIYSENPAGTDSYTYTISSDQCGTYSGEGDCYNREHSFPRSWFGGSVEPMNSDVHHIFATDGYVNSKRGSYPLGEVGSASWTSANGSKLGSSASGLGYNGTVFEPIDEFKGDLARAIFYMATRYENAVASWETNSSFGDAILDGSSDKVFEDWALDMLKSWHFNDPVSTKEIARNDAAYAYQGNRNPFVDRPQFVSLIWGGSATTSNLALEPDKLLVNYRNRNLIVKHQSDQPFDLVIVDFSGRDVLRYQSDARQSPEINIPITLLPDTFYIIKVYTENKVVSKKLLVGE